MHSDGFILLFFIVISRPDMSSFFLCPSPITISSDFSGSKSIWCSIASSISWFTSTYADVTASAGVLPVRTMAISSAYPNLL